jgi:hypothetical protein
VARGVSVGQRVIDNVGVPVQRLRAVGRLNEAVRADEPPDGGIIVASVVKVQPRAVQPLAGETDYCERVAMLAMSNPMAKRKNTPAAAMIQP